MNLKTITKVPKHQQTDSLLKEVKVKGVTEFERHV
jgi:hypothetical protein